jgi:hypothetical protein
MKLPHVSYFGYGESLPVLEQGTTDPGGLGQAYENLALANEVQKEGVKPEEVIPDYPADDVPYEEYMSSETGEEYESEGPVEHCLVRKGA